MASDSMARALSRARVDTERAIEDKRQALESPTVSAFIKEGASLESRESEQGIQLARTDRRGLVHINAKIPDDLYMRLRRAVFENQLAHLEPNTMQELVAQALHAELKRLGY